MSNGTSIQLTPEAERALRAMQTLPERVVRAIVIGMDKANHFALTRITEKHMTGTGPFPVSEHRVGVRTNNLRGSMRASAAAITGETTVESDIGSPVRYGWLHEFGGTIHHAARKVRVRLRTDARGDLLRHALRKNLAVFAKADHKRARETEHDSEAHDVVMPERAYTRTGLAASVGDYRREISAAIVAAWDQGAKT
jgi:hypothetical protein